MGRHVLRRHILGYSVCLCPIKRMAGLYGLKSISQKISINDETQIKHVSKTGIFKKKMLQLVQDAKQQFV